MGTITTRVEQHQLPVSSARDLCFVPAERRFAAVGSADLAHAIAPVRRGYTAGVVPTLAADRRVTLAGTTLLFLEDRATGHMVTHYFHLLEHLLAVWPYVSERRDAVARIVLVADGRRALDHWRGPHCINEKLLRALFPRAEVLPWRSFLALAPNGVRARLADRLAGRPPQALVLEDAVIVDRALTLGEALCAPVNKMLAHFHGSFRAELWQRMAVAVLDALAVPRREGATLRVTHVLRTSKRRLADTAQARLHAAIEALPGVSLRPLDFAKLSYEQQLEAAANSDVLLGVHGNGLSHGFFLPAHGAMIELFPAGGHALDYRFLVDFRGLGYLGVHPEHGVIDQAAAFRIGGHGDLSSGIADVALEPIVAFLRERVDAHRNRLASS